MGYKLFMRNLLLCGILGSIVSFFTLLSVEPNETLLFFGESATYAIWVILGGLVGLLCGLVVNGVIWTIRTLSGNWTRLGR